MSTTSRASSSVPGRSADSTSDSPAAARTSSVTSRVWARSETPNPLSTASCTPPSAERTRVTTPAKAKSPCRRAISPNPYPSPGPATGNSTAVRISSTPTAVVMAPWKNAAAGTVRRPPGPVTSSVAPRQDATAGSSAPGSACARLPQTVPRLRSSRWPTNGSARPTRGTSRAAGLRSSCRWRVVAPTRRTFPRRSIVSSPAAPLMSTSVPGRPRRMASTGTRDWPPASTLPSPSVAASSATASSRLAGRT